MDYKHIIDLFSSQDHEALEKYVSEAEPQTLAKTLEQIEPELLISIITSLPEDIVARTFVHFSSKMQNFLVLLKLFSKDIKESKKSYAVYLLHIE